MSTIGKLLRFKPMLSRGLPLSPQRKCYDILSRNQTATESSSAGLSRSFDRAKSTDSNEDKRQADEKRLEDDDKPYFKKDNQYVLKFTHKIDVKKVFKEFYSLYGPLFVVCHVGISLTSLGLWSGLVWMTVDPVRYIPDWIFSAIGETAVRSSSTGGKFVIAYALHKLLLPLRLAGSIYLTKFLSTKIKLMRRTPVKSEKSN